jgi:hypothetical protein
MRLSPFHLVLIDHLRKWAFHIHFLKNLGNLIVNIVERKIFSLWEAQKIFVHNLLNL